MSRYDDALRISDELTRVIHALENQVTTSRRDKTGLRWQFGKCGDRCMTFTTDCYSGYYGSSSASSDNSDALGKEIAKTLTDLKSQIIEQTIARCKVDIANAKKLAADEAKKILDEVTA